MRCPKNNAECLKLKKHVLVKKTEPRKYRCRMCREQLPSCRALTIHHQTKHGILYCKVCHKAFNNPRSLTKHMYQHQKKKHVCGKCGEKFPFASQLKTHKLTHLRPNQKCMYPNCNRRFKNYKTKEKRNFNSHRLQHSRIEKYFCEKCGKGFIFNTQKRRHVNKKTCD